MKYILPFLLLFAFSCKPESHCSFVKDAPVHKIEAVDTMKVNTIQEITIEFGLDGGCAKPGELEINKSDKIFTAKIPVYFEGCICTAIYGYGTEKYLFTPTEVGTYLFKVEQAYNPISVQIVVTE